MCKTRVQFPKWNTEREKRRGEGGERQRERDREIKKRLRRERGRTEEMGKEKNCTYKLHIQKNEYTWTPVKSEYNFSFNQ